MGETQAENEQATQAINPLELATKFLMMKPDGNTSIQPSFSVQLYHSTLGQIQALMNKYPERVTEIELEFNLAIVQVARRLENTFKISN